MFDFALEEFLTFGPFRLIVYDLNSGEYFGIYFPPSFGRFQTNLWAVMIDCWHFLFIYSKTVIYMGE